MFNFPHRLGKEVDRRSGSLWVCLFFFFDILNGKEKKFGMAFLPQLILTLIVLWGSKIQFFEKGAECYLSHFIFILHQILKSLLANECPR